MHTALFIDILVWVPTALLFIYVLWTSSYRPRPLWLKLLNPVAFWFFLPWFAPMVLACLEPSLPRLAATLSAAVLFAGHFLWPAIPHQLPRSPRAGSRLRIMTTNLYKRNTDNEGIVDTILEQAPDVVAMQELQREHVQAIEKHLSHVYPYQVLCPGIESEGMGLISRYPFRSAETRILTPGANPTQTICITFGKRNFWILNVHPRIPRLHTVSVAGITLPVGLNSRERREDIIALRHLAKGLGEDVIMLGDMNTTNHCEEYQLIPSHWRSAHEDAGWGLGLTYPVNEPFYGVFLPFPLFRIDHVLYHGKLGARTCRTGQMPGSDHRYVIAELEEKEQDNKGSL